MEASQEREVTLTLEAGKEANIDTQQVEMTERGWETFGGHCWLPVNGYLASGGRKKVVKDLGSRWRTASVARTPNTQQIRG